MRHRWFNNSSYFPNYATPSTCLRTYCVCALSTRDCCYSVYTATSIINCLGYSKWLQLQVLLYIRLSAAYTVIMCTIRCGIQSSVKCWELASGRMNMTIVLEEDTCCVVGHLPRLISCTCYFFLRTGGTITAEVTG